MEADDRPAADTVTAPDAPPGAAAARVAALAAFLERLAAQPYAYDLRMALRRVECVRNDLPRLGCASSPSQEAMRVGQDAAMTFAPASISRLRRVRGTDRVWLLQRVFGLLGPNGALPTHLTEYAYEREVHFGDMTFTRFLDMLTHRVALQFYRAWAQAQPVVGADRPSDNRHTAYVAALCGETSQLGRSLPALEDEAKLYFAGRLGRAVRSADGLAAWIAGYLRCPVAVEQFVLHSMPIESAGLTLLGSRAPGGRERATLGGGASLGARVQDAQHKFRLVIGPLDATAYAAYLPGGAGLTSLRALVQRYVGDEFAWDVRLILAAEEVPRLGIAASRGAAADAAAIARLGFGAWLGTRRSPRPAADLLLNPETAWRRARAAKPGRSSTDVAGAPRQDEEPWATKSTSVH